MWEGIIGGALTFLGLALLYRKLPNFFKVQLSRRGVDLFIDIGASLGIYLGLAKISGSFAALIACSVVAVLISCGLSYERSKYWEA